MTSEAPDPKRPARRQVDFPVTAQEEVHPAGTVNIWTGRVLKEYRKQRETRKKEASKYRCLSKIDSGWTRGEGSGVGYCCLYFARGICHHGSECNFLHRVPDERMEVRHRTDYSHDIFGRERLPGHMDGRKKGVGSYERECKTLYVHYGGAGTLPTEQLRQIVLANFTEWGPVENVHLAAAKTLAFVRYEWRSSAEFAKAAMHQQTLRGCDTTEVLDVRWANEDPNPRAVARVQHEREQALRDAYVRAVNDLPPDAKRARIQQLHLAATVRPGTASASYPDTDSQYGGGYRHQYEGWDQFLYQQAPSEGGEGELEGPARERPPAEPEAVGGPAADADAVPDEAAQWAAWQEWQAQHPHGVYPGGADDPSRYMRPADHYWEAQAAYAAQAAAAQAAAAQAAQQPTEQQAGGEDEVAEEALGLIAGYGSGSDSDGGGSGEGEGGDRGAS